jgi:hypothetical protein
MPSVTQLLASEQRIGSVGGEIGVVSASPTVTASAYSAGQTLGVLLTFSGIARAADKSFVLQAVTLQSKAAQTGIPIDLVLFNATPSGSTITDRTAVAIVAADYAKAIARVSLTDWTGLGTASFAQALNLGLPIFPVSGTADIYGLLIARAAITPASTSDFTVVLRALRN